MSSGTYGKCLSCGTWRSEPAPKEMYGPKYWSHEQGKSTITEQKLNMYSSAGTWRSRMSAWLSVIGGIKIGRSFEIGYAPGSLMEEMMKQGWDVDGCDPSIDGVFWGEGDTMQWTGDLVLAMDVLEHVDDPWEMLKTMLAAAPVAIVQTPTIMYDGYPMPDRMWVAGEHVHVFTLNGMRSLVEGVGGRITGIDIWLPGHELFKIERA